MYKLDMDEWLVSATMTVDKNASIAVTSVHSNCNRFKHWHVSMLNTMTTIPT